MKKGNLILICGLPGSGKTTLAKKLEKERNAVRFCADEWIIAFIDNRNNTKEIDRLRNPVEQQLWKTTRRLLKLGITVILENGFWIRKEREQYRLKAKDLGVNSELYFLDIPYAELSKRVSKRNLLLDRASLRIDLNKLKYWQEIFEPPDSIEGSNYDVYKKLPFN